MGELRKGRGEAKKRGLQMAAGAFFEALIIPGVEAIYGEFRDRSLLCGLTRGHGIEQTVLDNVPD
jgi:hypothetical protein